MRFLFAVNLAIFVITAFVIKSVYGEERASGCGICEPSNCESPRNCLAGMVKDSCDCCYLCGNKEGERCEHKDIPSRGLGACGEYLHCRVRSDLERNDPPEAVCVCSRQNPLCGSDGVTYDNICQLTEARYSRRDGLRAVSSNPCVKPPIIVLSPQNIINRTGSYAVMTCETKAWPLPSIYWELQQGPNRTRLTGDNGRLGIQSRNGPNKDEKTSWLLFFSLSEEDEGEYFCKAENDFGSVLKSATVSVIL